MFIILFVLGANAEEPVRPAEEAISLRDVATAMVAMEEAERERAVREDLADKREHEQRLELLKACKVGVTGQVFGSAIKARCDFAFASAEAIRSGQPVSVTARGSNVSVSANQYYGFGYGYGGYGFQPGLYQNIAYGGTVGQTGLYDPTAERISRLTLTVSGLRAETDNNSKLIGALTE